MLRVLELYVEIEGGFFWYPTVATYGVGWAHNLLLVSMVRHNSFSSSSFFILLYFSSRVFDQRQMTFYCVDLKLYPFWIVICENLFIFGVNQKKY